MFKVNRLEKSRSNRPWLNFPSLMDLQGVYKSVGGVVCVDDSVVQQLWAISGVFKVFDKKYPVNLKDSS